MICTSEFTFIHLHKAGGQAINEALLACIPDAREVGYHLPISRLPEDASARPIIGVIRNPWDWYVSWYAFNNLRGVKNPLFNIVSRGKQAGFKETIENLLRYPEPSPKNKIMKTAHLSLLPEDFTNDRGAGFTKACINDFSSETQGYFTLLVNRMFGHHSDLLHWIEFERLNDDLNKTLRELRVKSHDVLTNFLAEQPKRNVSARGHYSQYYDDELKSLVEEKEQTIIKRFGYSFNRPEPRPPKIDIEPGKRVTKVGGTRQSFLKLGQILDLTPLQEKVAKLTESDWEKSDRHTQFAIHKETQSIQLLNDDMSHTEPLKTRYYDAFADEVNPILDQLERHFGPQGTFIRALLARLNGRSEINPHVDKGYSLVNCNRIHIPIVTNEKVTFTVGGESRALAVGEVWEINNADVHAVTNTSEQPRVHLIIDWTPTETLLTEKKPYRMDLPIFYREESRATHHSKNGG